MTAKDIQNNFDAWWNEEGHTIQPREQETAAEHLKRITNVAWTNGAYKVQRDVWERASRYYDIKP